MHFVYRGKIANKIVRVQTCHYPELERPSPISAGLLGMGDFVAGFRDQFGYLENIHSINHKGSSCRSLQSQGTSDKILLIYLVWWK